MKTAKEFGLEFLKKKFPKSHITDKNVYISLTANEIATNYARYYHEEKLKELTDEVINNIDPLPQSKCKKTFYKRIGAKWTKQWYLKNNK